MNLKQYLGVRVHIATKNGKIFEGKVADYCYPEDNESSKESIILDSPPIEFYEKDIRSIRIIGP